MVSYDANTDVNITAQAIVNVNDSVRPIFALTLTLTLTMLMSIPMSILSYVKVDTIANVKS